MSTILLIEKCVDTSLVFHDVRNELNGFIKCGNSIEKYLLFIEIV